MESLVRFNGRPFSQEDIRGAIGRAVEFVLPLLTAKYQERRGVYASLVEEGVPLLTCRVGPLRGTIEELQQFHDLSVEKPTRTWLMYIERRHCSSWESRDENAKPQPHYGGGVSIENTRLCLGISALSEYADEMICVLALRFLDWITKEYARKIFAISKNPFAGHSILAPYFN